MSKRALELSALTFAGGVLVLGGWFWIRQILSVIDLLRMAYG